MDRILKLEYKKEERFLRKKAEKFNFNKFSRKEIADILARMRRTMRLARGIGLSANQIGLQFRVFVAELPGHHGGKKFYALFNPIIDKASAGRISMEEGCLSVPGKYGLVERPERITVSGCDKNGKPVKIKAWGLLARVLQHEVDHLNGMLFIDRTKDIYRIPTSERLQKREKILNDEK